MPPNPSSGSSPSVLPHSLCASVQHLPLASLNLLGLARPRLPSPSQSGCQKPLPSPQPGPAAAAPQRTQPGLLLAPQEAQGPRGAQGPLSTGNRSLSSTAARGRARLCRSSARNRPVLPSPSQPTTDPLLQTLSSAPHSVQSPKDRSSSCPGSPTPHGLSRRQRRKDESAQPRRK